MGNYDFVETPEVFYGILKRCEIPGTTDVPLVLIVFGDGRIYTLQDQQIYLITSRRRMLSFLQCDQVILQRRATVEDDSAPYS